MAESVFAEFVEDGPQALNKIAHNKMEPRRTLFAWFIRLIPSIDSLARIILMILNHDERVVKL